MTRSMRLLEMRWRRSHIGSQLGTQTLSAQSSHSGQLDTHRQRSPGWLQLPSAAQRYGVGAAARQADAGSAVLAVGQLALHEQTRSWPQALPGLSQRQACVDARLTAAILPAVAVLALLAGRALVALAAEHRREAGDALAVEAAEAGLAVAGGLALLAAAVRAAVAMLALLADRAAIRFAAEDRREAGDAAVRRRRSAPASSRTPCGSACSAPGRRPAPRSRGRSDSSARRCSDSRSGSSPRRPAGSGRSRSAPGRRAPSSAVRPPTPARARRTTGRRRRVRDELAHGDHVRPTGNLRRNPDTRA